MAGHGERLANAISERFLAPADSSEPAEARREGIREALIWPFGGGHSANPRQSIPRRKRRLVARAIRHGEILRDPADAELLLRLTEDEVEAPPPQPRLLRYVPRLIALAWLISELVLAALGAIRGASLVALLPLVLWIAFERRAIVAGRARTERVATARRLHRNYLDAIGHPIQAEQARRPRLRPWPYRRGLPLALGLQVASIPLVAPLASLSIMNDRGSGGRLALVAVICSAGIVISAASVLIAGRIWRRDRGFRRRFAPTVLMTTGLVLVALWTLGMIDVLVFGK